MGDNQTMEIATMNNPSLFLKMIILQMTKVKIDSLKNMNGLSNPQKAKNKMYKLFLRLIDKDSSKELIKIDMLLSKAIKEFESRTGWFINHEKVYLCSTFKNDNDEIIYFEDFKVPRTHEKGFYLPDISESIDKRHREGEEQFYYQNFDKLGYIHELMAAKERILYGDYKPLKEEYVETIATITNYLGYSKTPYVQKLVLE